MKKSEKTLPVTERALIQRINRALAASNEVLKKARGVRVAQDAGDFFVIDVSINALIHKDVDLEDFGRRLGVLKGWERLAVE